MEQKGSTPNCIGAERRRKIHKLALENGSVSVTELAKTLDVAPYTIRRDLDVLDKQGKLIRSHGGAIATEAELPRPSYLERRKENLTEKAWIGEAAAKYLPTSGCMFLGPGSTTYQLATHIPESYPVEITTTSPQAAIYLAMHKQISVALLGGYIRMDSFATDYSLSDGALDMTLWDVAFLGMNGIDVEGGMTSIDRRAASYEKKTIENSRKLVVMCDASKIGRLSYMKVGPVSLIDVLITDSRVSLDCVQEFTAQGVEVVVTGPTGTEAFPAASRRNKAQQHQREDLLGHAVEKN